jgi:hypothetical protein
MYALIRIMRSGISRGTHCAVCKAESTASDAIHTAGSAAATVPARRCESGAIAMHQVAWRTGPVQDEMAGDAGPFSIVRPMSRT